MDHKIKNHEIGNIRFINNLNSEKIPVPENSIDVVEKEESNTSYSDLYSRIKLSRYMDDLIKFGIKSKELSRYNSNYKIDYATYNNQFTGIDNDLLLKLLNS